MRNTVSVRFKTMQICAATDKVVSETPWKSNLVVDLGLNCLANYGNFFTSGHGYGPAESFTSCYVGSGTNPTSIASGGAITFTQVGTTITASAPFFTNAMINGILKYGATGSAGQEIYITGVSSNLIATALTSFSITASQGTVWQVQAQTLQTQEFVTNSYRTNSGDNSTIVSGSSLVMQRTFLFPVQGTSYNVNEIGWGPDTTGYINGRVVLSSTDVVPTTNYYLVIMQLTTTFAPTAPLAVGNVGTGINTAGSSMLEYFACKQVDASGTSTGGIGIANNFCDANSTNYCYGSLATYTQQSATPNSQILSWPSVLLIQNNLNWVSQWSVPGVNVGLALMSGSITTTTTGQTLYGVGILNSSASFTQFDVLFTTPVTLPTGVFAPVVQWQAQWSRTLTN